MKMDDDFQSYLVKGALFDGFADIPCMLKFKDIVVPKRLAPFTARKRTKNRETFFHCFIHDSVQTSLCNKLALEHVVPYQAATHFFIGEIYIIPLI